MADHLSDEEQLQVLKGWWTENGRFLMLAIAAALAIYFGWQWWTQHQRSYAEAAAAAYTELGEAVDVAQGQTLTDEQQKTTQFLITQLQRDYGRSLYAANASLLAAKLAVDKNDLAVAADELKKVLDYNDSDLNVVASLRLAKVYLAQEKFDEALQLASYKKEDSFAASYAALRGDILAAKGDVELARSEYQQALTQLGDDSNLQRRVLEIKMSDLPISGDRS